MRPPRHLVMSALIALGSLGAISQAARADVAPSKDSKCAGGDASTGALWLGAAIVAGVAQRARRKD
jgi:MYXO-CTERM domain-containing protein